MDNNNLETRLWIFGYGSLCWRPGFHYNRAVTGYVGGYSRKFWQGNTTHRGTAQKPGRVATLVEDKNNIVWGCAYEINEETALPYLTNRECKLGGYMTKFTTFYPSETDPESKSLLVGTCELDACPAAFTVMLYIATPKNDLWLGDAPLHEIANQIIECSGPSGHNAEYLLRLAEFMHEHVPAGSDDHLFGLEFLVRSRIKEQKLCIRTLMGDGRDLRTYRNSPSPSRSPERNGQDAAAARFDSFQYTARVPEKNLRCLNI